MWFFFIVRLLYIGFYVGRRLGERDGVFVRF